MEVNVVVLFDTKVAMHVEEFDDHGCRGQTSDLKVLASVSGLLTMLYGLLINFRPLGLNRKVTVPQHPWVMWSW